MSVDTEAASESEQSIEELAQSLGEAIAELPEYQSFIEAREAVEQDEDAQKQIAEFERARRKYMDARERGAATRDDLREMQKKAGRTPRNPGDEGVPADRERSRTPPESAERTRQRTARHRLRRQGEWLL
ncbi:YlbF family regulator [Natrialbaceae archaeon GCM10025896]